MVDLDLLRSIGTVMPCAENDIIIREDEYGDNMYIVLKGSFGVFVNSLVDFPVRVADIGQGAFFGEMSLIDKQPRSATIMAEENGAVLSIEQDKFMVLLEKCPDIADRILAALRKRAETTADSARARGQYVPPMPAYFEPQNAKEKLSLMKDFSQHIRKSNSLLYETPVLPKDVAKLLPAGYTLFNVGDENDNTSTLQKKTVNCPFCRKSLTTYMPHMTNLMPLVTEFSGRIIYKDFNILLYTNVVCPSCYYTDSYREFSRYRPAVNYTHYRGEQFKNVEQFTGFADTHTHTVDEAILSYYQNISCIERISPDPLRFAKAWIRLHWLYRDLQAQNLARESAQNALAMYEKYLDRNKGCLSAPESMRINAILGELSVAVEDYKRAQAYFEEIVFLGKSNPSTQDLVNESLRRRKEIKELDLGR